MENKIKLKQEIWGQKEETGCIVQSAVLSGTRHSMKNSYQLITFNQSAGKQIIRYIWPKIKIKIIIDKIFAIISRIKVQ